MPERARLAIKVRHYRPTFKRCCGDAIIREAATHYYFAFRESAADISSAPAKSIRDVAGDCVVEARCPLLHRCLLIGNGRKRLVSDFDVRQCILRGIHRLGRNSEDWFPGIPDAIPR